MFQRLTKIFILLPICLSLLDPMVISPRTGLQKKKTDKKEEKKDEKKEDERDKKKGATTHLRIYVTGGEPAQPIGGARVLVKSEEAGVNFIRDTTTNSKGDAILSGVPQGKVLIQVTLVGWISYGERCVLNSEHRKINIELKPSNTQQQ